MACVIVLPSCTIPAEELLALLPDALGPEHVHGAKVLPLLQNVHQEFHVNAHATVEAPKKATRMNKTHLGTLDGVVLSLVKSNGPIGLGKLKDLVNQTYNLSTFMLQRSLCRLKDSGSIQAHGHKRSMVYSA